MSDEISIDMTVADPSHQDKPQFQEMIQSKQTASSSNQDASKYPQGRKIGKGKNVTTLSSGDVVDEKPLAKKYVFNTTNSIVTVDSTIANQRSADSIGGVAFAILCHLRNKAKESQVIFEAFSERYTPIDGKWSSPEIQNPSIETVFRFIRSLILAVRLNPETLIVALVYVERLLQMNKSSLGPTTWRPIVCMSIICAAKTWNDLAVYNVDFAAAIPEISIASLAKLEIKLLELLRYSVVVTAQQYAKYYFELRSLPNRSDILDKFLLKPVVFDSE